MSISLRQWRTCASTILVPSIQHGAAAKQSFWMNDYDFATNDFGERETLPMPRPCWWTAAEDAGFCE